MANQALILEITEASLAEKAGIKKGDLLHTVNRQKVRDIIDYQIYTNEDEFEVEIIREKDYSPSPERISYHIYNQSGEPFGLKFETAVFDKVRTCTNKCVFCFIDQLPRGLRKSLYLKDDDFRLSFLHGNFITLTNLYDTDIRRIINQRLSPLYLSLHTTDKALRKVMINSQKKDKTLDYLKSLLESGIEVHLQVVVCPGMNDGNQLSHTLYDLRQNFSQVESIGVVPVGLTKHRSGLFPISPFTKDQTVSVIKRVEHEEGIVPKVARSTRVYLADEFYLMADLPLPSFSYYGNFPQIENGIGISRAFLHGVEEALKNISSSMKISMDKTFFLVTGVLGARVLRDAIRSIEKKLGGAFHILPVQNALFGKNVTVTGLLSGKDIIDYVKQHDLRKANGVLLIPDVLLNENNLFIDDTSLDKLCEEVVFSCNIVSSQGDKFVTQLLEMGG